MKKSFFTTALAVATLAFSCFANAGVVSERVEKSKTLLVGTEGTYAPFTFHDEKNHLTGFDVEVARKVAERLGLQIEFKKTAWDGIFAGLNAKRFDLIANQVTKNEDRSKKYDFSTPYTYSSGVIVTRANDDSIKSFADIKGKKAAQSATSNWSKLAAEHGAVLVTVDSLAQNLKLVADGRVDLTVNDKIAVLDYMKKNPNSGLKIAYQVEKKDEMAFAFLKGEEQLVEKVNKALDELRKDGTLKQLSIEWFGDDITQ